MKILSVVALSIFLTLFVVPTMLIPVSYAQDAGTTGSEVSGFKPLVPIPNLTADESGDELDTVNLTTFLNNLYKYLVGIAAILAIIQIIRGGLEISTQDSVSKHASGKEHIQQAILGLVLVLSPVLVFSIINPSILNLSVALPNLNAESPFANPTPPATSVQGGVIYNDGELAKKAAFTDEDEAERFVDRCTAAELEVEQSCEETPDGDCIRTFVTCYKETTFIRYQFKEWLLGFYHDQGVIPRDIGLANTFEQKCRAGSGTVEKESDDFLNINAGVNSCPADAGFTVPPGTDSRCVTDEWACKPN